MKSKLRNGIFKAGMCDKECLYLSWIGSLNWCNCNLM